MERAIAYIVRDRDGMTLKSFASDKATLAVKAATAWTKTKEAAIVSMGSGMTIRVSVPAGKRPLWNPDPNWKGGVETKAWSSNADPLGSLPVNWKDI